MGKILIVMTNKIYLEMFLNCAIKYGYDCDGFLWENKEYLMDSLDNYDNIEICVIEIWKPDLEIKKFVKKVRDKFKNCKFLVLFYELDKLIEEFLIEYKIDAYLTLPILPSQFLRSLFLLNQI